MVRGRSPKVRPISLKACRRHRACQFGRTEQEAAWVHGIDLNSSIPDGASSKRSRVSSSGTLSNNDTAVTDLRTGREADPESPPGVRPLTATLPEPPVFFPAARVVRET